VETLGTGNHGTTWSLSGDNLTFSNFNSLVGGNLHTLLSTFDYNGNQAVLAETGLTPGQAYVVTFYNAAFDTTTGGARVVNLTTSDGITTPVSFDEDTDALGATGGQASVTAGQVNLLRYTFVATAPTESLTITAKVAGTTMHVYGFSTSRCSMTPGSATALVRRGAMPPGTIRPITRMSSPTTKAPTPISPRNPRRHDRHR